MNAPAVSGLPGESSARLSAWVRTGLTYFAAQCYDALPAPVTLLDASPGDWPQLCTAVPEAVATAADALARLARAYRLRPAELFLIALAGEIEADFRVVLAIAELQAPERTARPALHLACALTETLFPQQKRLTPLTLAGCAAVRAGLLAIDGDGPLPMRSLRLDARLWATLGGDDTVWPDTQWLTPADAELPAATRARLDPLARALADGDFDVLVLRGMPYSGRGRCAAALAARLGLQACAITSERWAADAALAAACHCCGWLPVLRPRLAPGERYEPPRHPGYDGALIVLLGEAGAVAGTRVFEETLPAATAGERAASWAAAGIPDPPATVLGGPAIAALLRSAAWQAGADPAGRLLAARRQLAAPALRQLAQAVTPVAREALVLTASTAVELDAFIARCERRESAWRGLGPSAQAGAGAGVRALFAGESGTGKTLAAAVVATALGAPLYRVDIGALMNKYIGETEKNLAALLDHAAGTDAMLLFDEADALFGRRSDGGDTGERFANLLTNYLLTRIESHPGLVVLTSNHRARIDAAFTRRLDAIVEFPLPGPEERLALWLALLGERAPPASELQHLASYAELAGGHIRNAVIAAAAQQPDGPLPVPLLARMLAREYRKLGRSLPPALEALAIH